MEAQELKEAYGIDNFEAFLLVYSTAVICLFFFPREALSAVVPILYNYPVRKYDD